MALYDALKDFAGPGATVVASTVAGVFAYRQWLTAKLQADIALNKLKFDTFKERRDVFDAANEMIGFLLKLAPAPEDRTRKFCECRDRMRAAEFYFPDDLMSIIDNIIVKCAELDGLQTISGPLNAPESQTYRNRRGILGVELAHISAALPRLFAPYLGFYLLKNSKMETRTRIAENCRNFTAFGLILLIFALASAAVLR